MPAAGSRTDARFAQRSYTGHHGLSDQDASHDVTGYRHAPLGVLYRPKYWLWSSGSRPLGTPVWVY